MKRLLLLLLLHISACCFCQELPVVVPQSPQAASLSKYSEFPVGDFTGIPRISIPLYTISSGDITLPLELSYHAGGFRVNEEASWVGLGWTLTGDYMISQSVHGADDFTGYSGGTNVEYNYLIAPKIIDIMSGGSSGEYSDGCLIGETLPGQNGFNSGGGLYLGDFSFCHSNIATVDGELVNYTPFCNVSFDWEPDVFSLSMPGAGGKFVLGQHDTAVYFLEKQDLKVKKNNKGFLVTTSDGIQYEFYKRSITTNVFNQEISAEWHLTRIISSKNPGKQLRIVYKEGDWINQYSYGAADTVVMSTTAYTIVPQTVTTSKYKETYIDSILYDEGFVVFYKKNNKRDDLKNADLLDSIRVFNYKKAPIKSYVFKTTYFIATNLRDGYLYDYLQGGLDSLKYLTHRLRLDTLIEKNGKKDQKKHVFEYSDINLPRKDSYSQDHWGFYNGANNNHLIPAFEGELFYQRGDGDYPIEVYQKINGADRKADPYYAKACILNKIIYPTGGSTSFEFEANTYENIMGEYNAPYFYEDYYKCYDILCRPGGEPIIDIDSVAFPQDAMEISSPSVTMAVFPWNVSSYPPPCVNNTSSNWFDIDVDGFDNLGHADQYHNRYYFNDPDQNGIEDNLNCYSFSAWHDNFTLLFNTTGPVRMNIHLDNISKYQSKRVEYSFSCRIKRPISSLPPMTKYAGGLRIKKIEHYDGINANNNIIKTYEYTNGILKSPVRYYHLIGSVSEFTYTRYQFSSNARNSLSYNQGSHIGYSKVIEKMGTNGESGKTESVFNNQENRVMQMNFRPPSVPNSYQELFDGKLVTKNIYDYSGALVSKTVNHYDLLDQKIIKGIFQTGNNGVYSIGRGGFHYYPIYTRWEALTGTDEIAYDRNTASHFVTNSKFYGYTGNNHIKPTFIKNVLSDSSEMYTYNSYAGDFTFTELDDSLRWYQTNYQNNIAECDDAFYDCLPSDGTKDSCYALSRTAYDNAYGKYMDILYPILKKLKGEEYALGVIRTYSSLDSYHVFSACIGPFTSPCVQERDSCRQFAEDQLKGCLANYQSSVKTYRNSLEDEAEIIDKLGQKAPGTLVESVTFRDSAITDGTLYQFKSVGSSILPSDISSLSIHSGMNFTPSSITNHNFSYSNQYESQIKIDYYDNGNIKEALKTDDYTTTYIWGYNENYPVAKIENLPYASLLPDLKTAIDSLQYYSSMSDESIRNSLKQLNTTIRELLGPRVMISTYTYIPQVGVTSETNPNNVTIYYEYDNMGRLNLIRDNEGNIVKTFKYQYK